MSEWRDVPGFDGRYTVNDVGEIIREAHILDKPGAKTERVTCKMKARVVTPKRNNRGYWQVRLYNRGECHHLLLHRVVAMAFIENPNQYPQVNHIDENKDNNSVANLEWCTNMQNRHHGTGIERMAKNHDYKKMSAMLQKPVLMHDLKTGEILVFSGHKELHEHISISKSALLNYCRGKRPRTGSTACGKRFFYLAKKATV